MRYDELEAVLMDSNADAWRAVDEDGPDVWVLADDISVSMRAVLDDASDRFGEPWAMVPADPHAWRQGIRACLNGQTIIHYLFVIVDGGRCALPLPELAYDEAGGERRWHLTDRQFRLGSYDQMLWMGLKKKAAYLPGC